MSMPGRDLYCSKCDYKTSFHSWVFYVYKIDDNDEVGIPEDLGWCFNCNSVVRLHLGLSVEYISNQRDSIVYDLNSIKTKYPNSHDLPASLHREVNKMLYELQKSEKYLKVLNGVDSINNCLECGSIEVIPFDTHNSTIYHINCGGQLTLKTSEVRYGFEPQKKILTPVIENLF
jgi:hypothetical protein